jgi:HSP20 family protein
MSFYTPSAHDPFVSVEEGQLSLDVFRDGTSLVIRSTMAGVRPEDLEISVHGDLLTIRGSRMLEEEVPDAEWIYRECFWGAFSRSVVLPYEVVSDDAEARLKNGLLEIRIPIRESGKKVQVQWEG